MATLAIRSAALNAVRRFFLEAGYLEVETPVLLPAPALELHIDAIPTGTSFLRTSPELHMKRLLADGYERIFQLGPCFRHGERGNRHHPEFTMLEWYRTRTDYLGILDEMRRLIPFVCREVTGSTTLRYQGRIIETDTEWVHWTVAEAYRRFAGWDPTRNYDPDRFDMDLIEKVEPALPLDRPVVLMEYPIEAAALSKHKPGVPPVAERWELYLGGLELANAFSELTDAAEQRQRFEECAEQRRHLGKTVYPMDERFLDALEKGMPPSGGVALGFDRLVMLLADTDVISNVRPFAEDQLFL